MMYSKMRADRLLPLLAIYSQFSFLNFEPLINLIYYFKLYVYIIL